MEIFICTYNLLSAWSRFFCAIYSSSRNTRVFRHEIRAQSDARLHREYNLAMKNKASGGSQPRKEEGASHLARRGKNAEAFLNNKIRGW